MIADISRDKFGLTDNPTLTELVRWADIIDAARFPSAEMAVMRADPALWLMTVVENYGDEAFLSRMIPRLLDEPLDEIAKSPEIQAKWIPLRDAHLAFIELVRGKSQEIDRVVYVDLSANEIDVVGKFVTYALFPKSVYSVMISRGRTRSKFPWVTTRGAAHHAFTTFRRFVSATAAEVTPWWEPSRSLPATWAAPCRSPKTSPASSIANGFARGGGSREARRRPLRDAVVRTGARTPNLVVLARGMNPVGQQHTDHLAIEIAPDARAGEPQVPDRAGAKQRSRRRPFGALTVEPRSQRTPGSRLDQGSQLVARQKPICASTVHVDQHVSQTDDRLGGTEESRVTGRPLTCESPSVLVVHEPSDNPSTPGDHLGGRHIAREVGVFRAEPPRRADIQPEGAQHLALEGDVERLSRHSRERLAHSRYPGRCRRRKPRFRHRAYGVGAP